MNDKHPIIQLQRKAGLAAASPERHTSLRAAAENLSRRNVDAAVVELLMEAVQRMTFLAYEGDDDGLCNVDEVTAKLLIPAPWGRAGYARWGLRPAEGVCLREMMQQRQQGTNDRPPGVFFYDRNGRSWRVNFFDFDREEDAQKYWVRWPLSVHELRAARKRRLG